MQSLSRLGLTLASVLVFSAAAQVRAADYYINASGPLGDGSGSSADNAADATPGKYNALVVAQKTPGTTIIYAPGTYFDYPALPMYSGVTHRGSGIDSTIIKMPDGAADGDFTPLFLASGSTISNFKFTDATVDFNSDKTTWWKKGSGKCIAFAFSLADHCTIQKIKFINIGEKKLESFPVFFNVSGSADGHINNNLVDSCIFTQPIKSGNSKEGGLTCIQMSDSPPKITTDNTNVVSNNQFIDLKAPEFSDLGYAQCTSAPTVTHNTASGMDALWFVEPTAPMFAGVTVQVTDNTLTNCGLIGFILMHPTGDFSGNLNVQNNTVTMTEAPYCRQGPNHTPLGVGVNQFEVGNPPVGNITVQGNQFTAPTPKVGVAHAVDVNPSNGDGKYFHVASLKVIDNTLINFPSDGSALNVSTNSAYVPNYSSSGNVNK